MNTTGKQLELISGQIVRERALSAKQANLIRDRSISSTTLGSLFTIVGSVFIRLGSGRGIVR